MSWIDLKVRRPTEADASEMGDVVWRRQGGHCFVGSVDCRIADVVAWMPITEFVPVPDPDPPDGYELLTDYDAKPDPKALFLDIGANRWIIRQHTENTYVFGTKYVVPVTPPTPPVPQYRPFKDAEEFKPFRDRWWCVKGEYSLQRTNQYVKCLHHGYTWEKRFEQLEFEDGTPFGMPVEPAEID